METRSGLPNATPQGQRPTSKLSPTQARAGITAEASAPIAKELSVAGARTGLSVMSRAGKLGLDTPPVRKKKVAADRARWASGSDTLKGGKNSAGLTPTATAPADAKSTHAGGCNGDCGAGGSAKAPSSATLDTGSTARSLSKEREVSIGCGDEATDELSAKYRDASRVTTASASTPLAGRGMEERVLPPWMKRGPAKKSTVELTAAELKAASKAQELFTMRPMASAAMGLNKTGGCGGGPADCGCTDCGSQTLKGRQEAARARQALAQAGMTISRAVAAQNGIGTFGSSPATIRIQGGSLAGPQANASAGLSAIVRAALANATVNTQASPADAATAAAAITSNKGNLAYLYLAIVEEARKYAGERDNIVFLHATQRLKLPSSVSSPSAWGINAHQLQLFISTARRERSATVGEVLYMAAALDAGSAPVQFTAATTAAAASPPAAAPAQLGDGIGQTHQALPSGGQRAPNPQPAAPPAVALTSEQQAGLADLVTKTAAFTADRGNRGYLLLAIVEEARKYTTELAGTVFLHATQRLRWPSFLSWPSVWGISTDQLQFLVTAARKEPNATVGEVLYMAAALEAQQSSAQQPGLWTQVTLDSERQEKLEYMEHVLLEQIIAATIDEIYARIPGNAIYRFDSGNVWATAWAARVALGGSLPRPPSATLVRAIIATVRSHFEVDERTYKPHQVGADFTAQDILSDARSWYLPPGYSGPQSDPMDSQWVDLIVMAARTRPEAKIVDVVALARGLASLAGTTASTSPPSNDRLVRSVVIQARNYRRFAATDVLYLAMAVQLYLEISQNDQEAFVGTTLQPALLESIVHIAQNSANFQPPFTADVVLANAMAAFGEDESLHWPPWPLPDRALLETLVVAARTVRRRFAPSGAGRGA